MGSQQPKQKKTMLARSSGKSYIYNAELAGDEYLGDSLTEVKSTVKLMCLETTTIEEPKRKGGKPKEVKEVTCYIEVSDNKELADFVKTSEIGSFGFIFEENEATWQVFLCKPTDNPLVFELEKYHRRYALSKNIPIEKAITGLKEDILYIAEN